MKRGFVRLDHSDDTPIPCMIVDWIDVDELPALDALRVCYAFDFYRLTDAELDDLIAFMPDNDRLRAIKAYRDSL